MADYRLLAADESNGVEHRPTGMMIPNEPLNRDWQAYVAWRDLGNTADPQYTTEEQAEIDRLAAILAKLEEMEGFDRLLLKLIVYIYQVGAAKGVWVKADFTALDATIVDDVQAMRTRLSELETLEAG